MATYYGSWIATDDWRAVMDVTTSTSATSVSFTVVGKCQSVYAYSSGWQGTLTSNGSGGTNSKTFSCSTAQTVSFKTNTFSVSRGTSAKTVTVKCAVYNGNYNATSTATATITVPALATYAITYNANGGSSTPATQTKYHGVAINLAAAISRANATQSFTVTYSANYTNGTAPSSSTATKTTSYSFNKWNTNSGGTGTSYAASESYSDNAALTLYATWTSSTSTTQVTLPTITRSGYTFNGWFTAASGGTPRGVAGEKYTPAASETLYAHWTQSTYTVTFNSQGGTSVASRTVNVGSNIGTTGSLPAPTRVGYTLDGWYTASSGGTKVTTSYVPTASVTLYAHWTAITYTVQYNSQGGSAISTQTKIYGTAIQLAKAPTRSKCSFLGWYTLADGSTANGTKYAAQATYSGNESLSLFAQWAGGTVSVSAARDDTTPTTINVRAVWTCTSTATSNSVPGTVTVGVTSTVGRVGTVSGATSVSKQTADLTNQVVTVNVTDVSEASATTITVTVTLSYKYGGASASTAQYIYRGTSYVGKAIRPLSFVHGSEVDGFEDGIAVGSIANVVGRFEVAMQARFQKTVTIMENRIDRDGTAPSDAIWGTNIIFRDCDGEVLGYLDTYQRPNKNTGVRLLAFNENTAGEGIWNSLRLEVAQDGTLSYNVSDPAAFRSAIATGEYAAVTKTTTVASVISAASGITISAVTYAERNGIAQLSVSCSGFSASTGTKTVGTVVAGKRPPYAVYATAVTSSYAPYAALSSEGVLTVYWATAPNSTTGYTIRFVYILA